MDFCAVYRTVLVLNNAPAAGTCIVLGASLIAFLNYYLKKETVGAVGRHGFVVYRLYRRTQRVFSSRQYLFKDADCLIFPLTANYVNHIYSGTSYRFQLLGQRNVVYSTSGKYHNHHNEEGKFGWKYTFLQAIENEWTVCLINSLLEKLQTGECVTFKSGDALLDVVQPIELGLDYIKYNGMVFSRDDIKSTYFADGKFMIEHHNYEGGMFSSKGDRMTVRVNNMSNKKAFLVLFNYFMGDA